MMMKKILFVSHCFLNTGAKVLSKKQTLKDEDALRVDFIKKALELGVQFVQLPCPEFTLYGARRWGHVYEQFDNMFFRAHCRNLLQPALLELKEYLAYPDRFEVLGIVGIDGSPSCGVHYTCRGDWGGELSGRSDLADAISSVRLAAGKGIFIEELLLLLADAGIKVPVEGIFAPEPDRLMSLLEF